MILDEVDLEIRRSFDRSGWLPLLDVDHPPPTVLIREFYSNLSVRFDDSNVQYVTSWIRGEENVITPQVVASLLVYLWYNSLFILMMRPVLLTASCHSSLVLPFSGVLILISPLMSLLSSIICFSRLHVIPFGLSLIYTLFPLRDVLFCMLLSLMPLFVFLLCLLAL